MDEKQNIRTTVTVTDKRAQVKLMKNINKPLPDGGVALPTSETGQRRRSWDLRKRKKKKIEIQIRTHFLPDNTLKTSLTEIIQYNILD